MVYLSSEGSRAVTECNHCNILAFPQILMALLETHSTALQETEKCLHPDHREWVYRVQQPGSGLQAYCVVSSAEKHRDSVQPDSTHLPLFTSLLLACFLVPFSCTQASVALKIEQCTPLGPASQKFVVSNGVVRFPWEVFCSCCFVWCMQCKWTFFHEDPITGLGSTFCLEHKV